MDTITTDELNVSQTPHSEETPDLVHTVNARTGFKHIRSINSSGEIITVGTVAATDFEGSNKVRGIVLDSKLSGRTHSLGAASKEFQVFDHLSVVQPILEAGFRPQQIDHARGGSSFLGIFDFPDQAWEDPITWDLDRFAPQSRVEGTPRLGEITLGLRVRSDLRRGHGVALTMGYFRLVCLNGLTVRILDMGSLSVDHRRWGESVVDDFMKSRAITSPDRLPTASSWLLEEVSKIAAIEDPKELATLPRLIREPANKLFTELNYSTRPDLVRQLNQIAETQETLTVLDLTNAWTNLAQATRSRWSIYDEADPAVKALRDLVELEGVRQGVKTFELSPN